jgi:branched-chain amino acid transport system permease protein
MHQSRIAEIIVLGLLALLPLGFGDNAYLMGLLTLLAVYGILLIGLDVTVGYLGQVNLSQAAFLGLGAYAAGLAVDAGWGLVPAVLLAVSVGLALGALLAIPALRLEGPQFALATLSFGTLTVHVINELEGFTGGAQGLIVVRPDLFGLELDASGFYWLCLALLALVWLGMRNLLASQWGRAFEALRDSPIATDAIGVGTYRHKIAAFALGSALGGLAGSLHGFNFQYLEPHSFGYELMVILLLGVVLGGRKSLWGALLGATIIALLPNLLSSRAVFTTIAALGFAGALLGGWHGLRSGKKPFTSTAPAVSMGLLFFGGFFVENLEDWRKAVFALMLFSIVLGLPEGLMGFVSRHLARLFKVPPAPLPEPADLDAVLPSFEKSDRVCLQVSDLKRYFGGIKAVDGLSMEVREGEIHGLIGPNGSGKSTAINVISGLYLPTEGQIELHGQPLPRGKLVAVAKAGVARTFQNLQLFHELTVLENVMVALRGSFRTPLPLIMAGLARAEERQAQAEALALLELVGLRAQARSKARDLPYGAQRFLEIARALACKPRLLILDEPAAGLAAPDARKLVGIIQRIRERHISVILIEHHMDVVTELCDRVTVLDGGKIIANGTPDEVKRHPKVIEAYLGAVETDDAPADAPVVA